MREAEARWKLWSSEHRLWAAVLWEAISNLPGRGGPRGGKRAQEQAHINLSWLKGVSERKYGCRWVCQHLGLEYRTVRRMALGGQARAYARWGNL